MSFGGKIALLTRILQVLHFKFGVQKIDRNGPFRIVALRSPNSRSALCCRISNVGVPRVSGLLLVMARPLDLVWKLSCACNWEIYVSHAGNTRESNSEVINHPSFMSSQAKPRKWELSPSFCSRFKEVAWQEPQTPRSRTPKSRVASSMLLARSPNLVGIKSKLEP